MFTTWSESGQNGSGDLGQSGGDDNTQTGSIGPQDTFKNPERLPALDLFSDEISHAGISFTTTVGSTAQHVNTSGFPGYWQALSNFGAGVSIAKEGPNYGLVMTYDGGLSLTSGGSNYSYSQLNQTATGHLTWNFAKHWQFRLRDTYLYSDDPFQPFFTFLGTTTPNNPNPVTYFPNTVLEQNQGHADLTYQLSPHDIINFTGDEAFTRYLRQQVTSFYNSVEYAGGVFYQHSFSARLASGGGYQFAGLDFGHGQSRAGTQTFEGFIQYVFSSKLTASLWIGPEVTNTKDIVPVFCYQFGCFVQVFHQTSLSVAEGGQLSWRPTRKDGLNVQVSRGVSNAGGFLGAAHIYQILGTYGRPINRVWSLGIGASYNDSTSVSDFRASQYLRSVNGTVGVSRKLFNDAWTMNAYYAFIDQKQNYFGAPITIATSGFGFTVRYTWDHGLGR